MILLVRDAKGSEPRRVEIAKAEVFFGKHAECDVVLSSPKVSRRHARLVEKNGGYLIEDLKSTNGTFLKGVQISGPQPVKAGEAFQIGDVEVLVEAPKGSEKAAEKAPAAKAAEKPAEKAPAAEAAKPAAKAAEKEKPKEEPKESDDVKKAKMFWASMESFLSPVWPFIQESAVSEILVNGPREIFIERKGKLVPAGVEFSEELLRAAVMNIAQYVGKRVNEENPYMDARLPDGSRVAVVLPPCSRKGPCISIRKFSKEKMSLKDLISFGSLSEDVVAFLDVAVKLRKNAIVSGGTSSGKTSLLNVVSALIPNDQRILVIEDSAELQLQQDHVLPLEAKPPDKHGKGEVTLRELVKASLRLRPDRIVVGEVRGGEALDLLQAMNTGHSGSLATIHASSPLQTLSRLETLTLFSGLDLPIVAIREQVCTAIEIIIQAARLPDGSRKVTHISEVLDLSPDGRYQVQDIFRYVRTGMENGRIIGAHQAMGNLPTFLDEIELAGLELPPSLAAIAAKPGAREKMAQKHGGH